MVHHYEEHMNLENAKENRGEDIAYLACPHSHDDENVRTARYKASIVAMGWLMNSGEMIFNPLSHATEFGINMANWEYWLKLDVIIIRKLCSSMTVLMIDGWEESKGVSMELELARNLKLPIRYLSCEVVGLDFTYPYVRPLENSRDSTSCRHPARHAIATKRLDQSTLVPGVVVVCHKRTLHPVTREPGWSGITITSETQELLDREIARLEGTWWCPWIAGQDQNGKPAAHLYRPNPCTGPWEDIP